ncbi:hypothetical protein [Francisella sp. SYW-9]|uniref:hypothetical protein n=1 Tax=Francisella sp. SYW-9 TaxID=2610888 RepID=UPI00123C9986|nr:hypothetical protein [Francisella sp. SYW-9]
MTKKTFCLGILATLVISSCAMPDIKATKTAIKNAKDKSNSLSGQMSTPLSRDYISYSKKPFLGDKSFVIEAQSKPLPQIFNQQISLNSTNKEDISEYISKLSNLTNLNINISNEALEWLYGDSSDGTSTSSKSSSSTNSDDTSYPTKQIINYSGDLKGYLDELTNRFGLYWKYNYSTKKVTIFHTETQTFKLAIPESQIDDSTSITNTDANNKSNVSYTTKSADAFAEAINTIKSFDSSIKVSANNSYAMITVTATPRLMAEVSNYVKHFNQEAKKAVQVKIAIYEVKTTKSSNYGIDWNLVYNGTHTKINWDTTGLGEALSDSNLTTATIKYGIAGGMWAGSNIVASALQKYLDATYVQGFNFYSLNGQSTPLNNGQSQAYVKNLSVTTLGAGAVITADNVQTSVEQATVNTGFTGSVLSNVIGDKIFLRMSLNMSKLLEMQKLQYGNKDYPSTIELPHTESNKIIQNIMLKSGQTAVITGFSTDDNQLGQSSLADKKWWLLGGNQGTQGTKETLVVIVSAYEIGDNNG